MARKNPRPGEHDNITHALRAIYANEGRFLLTAANIRRIVYGVTRRDLSMVTEKGGWAIGFNRGGNETSTRGPLWEPIRDADGLMVRVFGKKVWQLTNEGRVRLLENTPSVDLDQYDALAWFENVEPYRVTHEFPQRISTLDRAIEAARSTGDPEAGLALMRRR